MLVVLNVSDSNGKSRKQAMQTIRLTLLSYITMIHFLLSDIHLSNKKHNRFNCLWGFHGFYKSRGKCGYDIIDRRRTNTVSVLIKIADCVGLSTQSAVGTCNISIESLGGGG